MLGAGCTGEGRSVDPANSRRVRSARECMVSRETKVRPHRLRGLYDPPRPGFEIRSGRIAPEGVETERTEREGVRDRAHRAGRRRDWNADPKAVETGASIRKASRWASRSIRPVAGRRQRARRSPQIVVPWSDRCGSAETVETTEMVKVVWRWSTARRQERHRRHREPHVGPGISSWARSPRSRRRTGRPAPPARVVRLPRHRFGPRARRAFRFGVASAGRGLPPRFPLAGRRWARRSHRTSPA